MLNDDGGVIDDLIVYRLDQNHYFLVVNAENEEDFLWLSGHRAGEVTLLIARDHFAAVAVQGQNHRRLFPSNRAELPDRNRIQAYRLGAVQVLVGRTGYTGEDGFEASFGRFCERALEFSFWS